MLAECLAAWVVVAAAPAPVLHIGPDAPNAGCAANDALAREVAAQLPSIAVERAAKPQGEDLVAVILVADGAARFEVRGPGGAPLMRRALPAGSDCAALARLSVLML